MIKEPYRLFFPLGLIFLAWGASVWLSQLWGSTSYPVELHRALVIHGFVASFIGSFLMTAIPQFSQTKKANAFEVISYLLVTLCIPLLCLLELYTLTPLFAAFQALLLLGFIIPRISKRKANPPYSFIFVLIGLFTWLIASFIHFLSPSEISRVLIHEAAIASIILGVGARLIPGILGHAKIVQAQKKRYETTGPLIRTIPFGFVLLVLAFIASYLLPLPQSHWVKAGVVCVVALVHWRILKLPFKRTHLTWSVWVCALLITLSFLIQVLFYQAHIHATHAFFINGVVLLCLLVATRVVCAHGPGVSFENSRWVTATTALIILASATRVSAYFLPDSYFTHLGYSSFLLVLATGIWAFKYLPYVRIYPVKDM